MRIKKFVVAAAVFSLISLLVSTGAMAQVRLNYSVFFPAPHMMTQLAMEWASEIRKRTNDQVQITVFPGGTLSKAEFTYEGVVRGISDIGMSVLGYTRGRFPLMEVIDLPLGYRSGTAATRLVNDFYRKFRPKELDEVKVMYFHAHGPGLLHTTKRPVHRVEDLKGLRIRTHGLSGRVAAALGGVPVAMPMSGTYDALDRGVVDGVLAPIEALEGWKLAEVARFTTQNFGSAYTTTFFVAMNRKVWNALPADVQKTIEQINEEWIERTGRAWDMIDKRAHDFIKARGGQIIALPAAEDARWREMVKPIFAEYLDNMKARGLPGEEALRFCIENLKRLQ